MSPPADKSTAVIGLLIFVIAAGAIGGAAWWQQQETARNARDTSAALLAAADQARADQVRAESAAARAVADDERTARVQQRTAQALERLTSNRPMTQCEAALELGRIGSRAHAAVLAEVMSSSRFSSVRVCAAGALVDLGEHAAAMQA